MSDQFRSQDRQEDAQPTLIVVHCPSEPWRIGGSALLPFRERGKRRLLGRGSPQHDDPWPRLSFARYADERIETSPPLVAPGLSRKQAVLWLNDDGAIEIENIGRCPLLHNGVRAGAARCDLNDVIEFGRQLMLLCVHRSAHALATSEHYPRHDYGHPDAFGIAGESPAIARLRRTIGMVSKRSEHVLIHGASGTGKELVARAIHGLSPRAAHTMVCRNAATIPEGLIDAELFGNVKNYPHAGMAARPGLVGQAHASTLFLDEFAELPATMQSHLLRVLDSGEYQRLGDAGFARSDLRLIAATNRPLTMIKEDLLARFGLRIEVPSLNERREDVPWLIRHVLERLSSSDPELSARLFRGDDGRWEPMLETDFVRRLLRHDYRTNVRELQVILWASIEQSDGELSWPAGSMAAHPGIKTPEPAADLDRAVTRERLQAALDRHNGRIEATWRELGLRNRYVLRRLITKYRLELRRRPS